jgi:hypothetical protein
MRLRRFSGGELLRPLLHSREPWWDIPPTPEEIEAFKVFLDRLLKVERYIKSECKVQRAILDKRVEEGDITDFEIQLSIDFFLRDGDPARLEGDDNMLVVITDVSTGLLDSDQNWNNERASSGYPLIDYHHPHLFHQLG